MKAPPGAGYVLVEKDTVVEMGGFGKRRKGNEEEVNEKTVFRAGSLGKTVIAMGIMSLVEAGRLDLEQPLVDVLPDVPIDNPFKETAPVRVAHLLEHSSGFDDMHFSEYYVEASMPLAEALSEFPASKTCRWRPGTYTAYSNVNYALLALIGERLSGRSWKDWIRNAVLDPLEMGRSGFGQVPAAFENAAWGWAEGKVLEENPRYRYEAALSFYTCAEDMGKMLACLTARGGNFLSKASVDRISAQDNPVDVSLGAGVKKDYVEGWELCYHTGKVDGFSAIFEWYPGQKRAFAVLFNSKIPGGVRSAALTEACRAWAMPLRKDLAEDSPVLLEEEKEGRENEKGCVALANPRNELLGKFDRLMSTLDYQRGPWTLEIGGEKYYRTKEGLLYKAGQLHVGGREGQDILVLGERFYEPCPCWRAPLLIALERALMYGSILLLLFMLFEGIRPVSWGPRTIDWGLLLGILPYWLARAAFSLLLHSSFQSLGSLSPASFSFFLITLLIPLLSLAGLYRLYSYLRRDRKAWRWGLFLPFALANAAMTAYMLSEGLVALPLWAV